MKKCHRNREIPVVHLKRFSLVKIFAHKIFTSQKLKIGFWGKKAVLVIF